MRDDEVGLRSGSIFSLTRVSCAPHLGQATHGSLAHTRTSHTGGRVEAWQRPTRPGDAALFEAAARGPAQSAMHSTLSLLTLSLSLLPHSPVADAMARGWNAAVDATGDRRVRAARRKAVESIETNGVKVGMRSFNPIGQHAPSLRPHTLFHFTPAPARGPAPAPARARVPPPPHPHPHPPSPPVWAAVWARPGRPGACPG